MRRRCSLRKHAHYASGNASRRTASSSYASNAAQVFAEKYERYGLASIWDDSRSAGILPCRVYLRHCVLAAEKAGQHVRDDLLDSTLLADRSTTLRQHLAAHPSLMLELPPPDLAHRYSG